MSVFQTLATDVYVQSQSQAVVFSTETLDRESSEYLRGKELVLWLSFLTVSRSSAVSCTSCARHLSTEGEC